MYFPLRGSLTAWEATIANGNTPDRGVYTEKKSAEKGVSQKETKRTVVAQCFGAEV